MENGRAKLALLNCTERVTVGPFSHFSDEQIQGIGKKKVFRMLKFAFVNMYFFLSPGIFRVCVIISTSLPRSDTNNLLEYIWPTYSVDTDVQYWWLVLSHRGKFTPEFTLF